MPDLTGAFIQRVELSDGRLTLTVDAVRRFRLLSGGVVVFEGVSQVNGSDQRMISGTPVLSGGTFVRKKHPEPKITALVMERQTGPGELDEQRFVIAHSSVSSVPRLRPAKTLPTLGGFLLGAERFAILPIAPRSPGTRLPAGKPRAAMGPKF